LAVPPSIQAGGSMESLNSSVAKLNGSCGAIQSANTAAITHASATAAALVAMGELRNECQKSLSRKRAQRPADTAVVAVGGRSRRRGGDAAPPAAPAVASATSA
jgi:hypothetical protein